MTGLDHTTVFTTQIGSQCEAYLSPACPCGTPGDVWRGHPCGLAITFDRGGDTVSSHGRLDMLAACPEETNTFVAITQQLESRTYSLPRPSLPTLVQFSTVAVSTHSISLITKHQSDEDGTHVYLQCGESYAFEDDLGVWRNELRLSPASVSGAPHHNHQKALTVRFEAKTNWERLAA
ncbi:hypothetical protein P153DRAFT_400454 [Dothidotthia symphoricarpi CBS 119687]|uniref:Uncharacterized protein n=1 Tax=Dothidotthia symphoricarpi CBS 119687 TaxID=1392245 RepID=A0A6A6A2Z4_9PLEO|nr:uncharacterized protein P153DRAFT_400454 [Dothidotthia symphoricarpi CBS 119687]KAF2124951.1 hypothetical protein P153DRAFT_400454 [Dothidotthia symphoricarpi CBS 119687]